MNNVEEKFNRAVKDIGGIYIPNKDTEEDQLLQVMLYICNEYIRELSILHSQIPKVNVYYINDRRNINACAFLFEDEYFIGINIASVIKLKEVFDMVFEIEKIYDGHIFNKDNNALDSVEVMYFAMMFLTGHEYSHIRFGHCALINHLFGNKINEITSNCLIDDGIFRQTLEFDADCCTIANLTNRILLKSNNIDELSKGIGRCMLACYILFKVFDNGEHMNYENYDLDTLACSTHPRPGIRQYYLGANICTVLYNHFPKYDVDKITNTMLDHIKIFENSLNEVISLRNIEMGVSYTQKGVEHINRIHNNWGDVRKMLLDFTHDELAPYEPLNFEPILTID